MGVYSPDSFTALEVPTLAKMNKLWSNDASFNDGGGIADNAIITRHLVAAGVTSPKLSLDFVQSAWSGLGNYSTSSTTYQDAGMKVTLPAIGTWLVIAQVRSLSPASGQFGVVQLYNFTSSGALTETERLSSYGAAANERQHPVMFARLVTTTTNNQVGIRVKSGGAYTHTIENDPNGYSSLLAIRIG